MIRDRIHQVALQGVLEPIVYKGQIQYERDDEGEFVLDEHGEQIPVTVAKYDNRVLMRLAEANLDEYAKGQHGGRRSGNDPKTSVNIQVNYPQVGDGPPPPSVELVKTSALPAPNEPPGSNGAGGADELDYDCLLYTSPSPRD